MRTLLDVATRINPSIPDEGRAPVREVNPPIEAGASARVTAAPVAGDAHLEQKRVLIAVDPHFDHALDLPAGGPLVPEFPARALPIPPFTGFESLAQGLRVHVGDHQQFAGLSVGGDAREEAVRPEPGRQNGSFFEFRLGAGSGEGVKRTHEKPL